MAHAMCICGNRMSNVNCPSDNILIIFKKSLMITLLRNSVSFISCFSYPIICGLNGKPHFPFNGKINDIIVVNNTCF